MSDPIIGEELFWVFWEKIHVEIAVGRVEVLSNSSSSLSSYVKCLEGRPMTCYTSLVNLFRDRAAAELEAASRLLEGDGLW